MPPKKITLNEITLSIDCPKCGKVDISLPLHLLGTYLTASSEECELCGSHGSITITITCPECQKNALIRLKDW